VTINGTPYTDGHICCGDGTFDREASIKHAEAKVAAAGEELPLRSLLNKGPPGSAPWATVVSKELKREFFVHLPLIIQGNIDDGALPESTMYAGALVAKFSSLLASVGPGNHEVSLRIAPRGMISGGEICEGIGGYKGGGTDGIALDMQDYCDGDAKFKAFIDGPLDGQHTSADVPGLRATFKIAVPEKLCKGGLGDRQAPEFITTFKADVVEHCNIAYAVATSGPPRDAVAPLLGGSVGSPAHIIIPPSELAGGITPMNTQEGREAGTRFFAMAFFFSSNPGDDDGLGAMVKLVCAKYERRNHQAVSSPRWESEGTFGNSRDKCAAFPIKNKQIRAAIERDAGMYSVGKAGGGGVHVATATGAATAVVATSGAEDKEDDGDDAAQDDGDEDADDDENDC